jgi:hypothetical protein
MSLQAIREDRILNEATATTGDAQRGRATWSASVSTLRGCYTGTVDAPGVIEVALRTRKPPADR